jgi:polyhydroxyalkanoate synthesis regulator phasin
MTDERTKVFLLLDEAEKRQKTAEQQQAALQDLLQASQTAKSALDNALARLPSAVQQAVDQAVPQAVAIAMTSVTRTAAQALDQATVGPVERLDQAVTRAERAATDIEQASREVNWQWVLLILLAGCLLGTLASYLLFTKLIRDDLDELRQQVQALQPATPPAEIPRKPRR